MKNQHDKKTKDAFSNNWGGYRPGAGRKKEKEETKVMRVPVSLIDSVKSLIEKGNENQNDLSNENQETQESELFLLRVQVSNLKEQLETVEALKAENSALKLELAELRLILDEMGNANQDESSNEKQNDSSNLNQISDSVKHEALKTWTVYGGSIANPPDILKNLQSAGYEITESMIKKGAKRTLERWAKHLGLVERV